MMLKKLPHPTIFAHRGSSAHAPENTLAAFELAVRQGADAVELDAKLSADGHVVVIHDQTVSRTTNGSGKVGELTLEQLRQLDAGSHFDIAFRGEPVPTLDEVFQAVGHAIYINVELTNYASLTDRLPDKVAELVKQRGLEKRVFFSSFNPLALLRVRKLLPNVSTGLLAFPGRSGVLARSWLGTLIPHQSLHPAVSDVTPGLIKRVQRSRRKIFVYTVNSIIEMRRLYAWDVDGIFTDDPLLARQVLAEPLPERDN